MTSPVRQMMAAPRLNPPSELMRQIDAQAEPLEAELERLRSGPGIPPPATARVRELRRQLAELDKQQRAEFARVNPGWVAFWGQTQPTTTP